MRLSSRFLAAALLPLLLGGCLKTKDEANVDAKGAGSIVQTYDVDVAMEKQIKETIAMFGSSGFGAGAGGGGTAPPIEEMVPDLFSEASTRALAKGVEGFTLTSFSDATKDGHRLVEVKADFASLEAVAKAGRFMNAAVELAKNEDGTWTFAVEHAGIGSYVEMLKSQGGEIPGLPKGTDLTAFTGMLEGYFGGLSSVRQVTFPTAVGETNGKKGEDGKTVVWTAGFSELMGKGAIHKATFSGEGLTLKPFRHAPNYGDMYRRMRESVKPAAPSPAPAPAPAPAPTTPSTGTPPTPPAMGP
jgi:hypothetical protein